MTIFNDIYDIFLKPIVEAANDVLKPVFEAINETVVVAEAEAAAKGYKEKKKAEWKSFGTKSPMTPDEARTQTEAYMATMEPHISGQIMTLIGIESATLGQVDMSLQGLTQLPYFQDDLQNLILAHRAEFTEGVYPALRRYQLKRFTPMIPETYRLALAASMGILDQDKYSNAMAESGLSSEWADVWLEQNYVYPPFAQLAELRWRGVIDDATFTLMMRRSGLKQSTVDSLKSLLELIPPSGDLVTMVVREAFDPKYVVSAPDVFAENIAKKGFTRTWADRYWTAHFLPMGVTQAYDNLRRGFWTKDEFLEFLRIADIHPRWREDIYNVAFTPPTVREMGYGYDVGVYGIEDITKYRRWGGLSPEDAEKAAISMVAYRTEGERESVRREYLYAFSAGRISEAELETNLRELGTSAPATALWMERARLLRERQKKPDAQYEFRVPNPSEAAFAFENGLRTEEWYRQTLKALDWTPDRINLAVERSKFDIEQKRVKEAKVTPRKITLAQIRDLYRLGKLTAEQMIIEMQKIGYILDDAKRITDLIIQLELEPKPPLKMGRADAVRLYKYRLLGIPDSDMLMILQDMVIKEGPESPTKALFFMFIDAGYTTDDATKLTVWTVINDTLPTLTARYRKGWITPLQMYNAIVEIGIPDAKANEIMETIVKSEQPERTAKEKDLTKSEIIKGVKVGILTTSQGAELLQGLGYDEDEAWYILYINAVVQRGDPECYWEMRKVVETAKKARGEPSKDIPDDLIMLDLRLKDAKQKLEKLKEEKATEEEIGAQAVAVGQLETSMRVVIGKLKL